MAPQIDHKNFNKGRKIYDQFQPLLYSLLTFLFSYFLS